MPARNDAPAPHGRRPSAPGRPGNACALPKPSEAAWDRPVGDLSFVAALLATGRGGVPALAPVLATPGGRH